MSSRKEDVKKDSSDKERVRIHLSYMRGSGSVLEAAFKQAGVDPSNKALMATIMALGAVAWSRNLTFAHARDGLVLVSPPGHVAEVSPFAGVGAAPAPPAPARDTASAKPTTLLPKGEAPPPGAATRQATASVEVKVPTESSAESPKQGARQSGPERKAVAVPPSASKAKVAPKAGAAPEATDAADPSEGWKPNPAVASIVAGAPNLIDDADSASSNDDTNDGFELSMLPNLAF